LNEEFEWLHEWTARLPSSPRSIAGSPTRTRSSVRLAAAPNLAKAEALGHATPLAGTC
jgi:hypothetical protein